MKDDITKFVLIKLPEKTQYNHDFKLGWVGFYHIYQPLRLGRIWHKVNF